MNKPLIITGINGLLSQNMVKEFVSDHPIYGVDLNPGIYSSQSNIHTSILDLTNGSAVRDYIGEVAPKAVIHTAAYTNVDRAETEKEIAFKVNAEVPANLGHICKDLDVPLIHISTDYVFNGENGPYTEYDTVDPRGSYSESKQAGEQSVLDSGARAAVIRPNVMYGHGVELKSSFVEWLINELKQGKPVNIVDDQYNNPTYARRLASVIRTILEKSAWDIWHFGSKEVVSRYTFALKIADTFGLSSELINAISTVDLNQAAPRPMRSGLICEKLERELGIPILSIGDELALLKEEMNVA